MSLQVVSFAAYRTSVASWRKADYDAHDFVQALKDQPFREYAWLKVRGQWKRFDSSSREQVVRWFGELAADYLRDSGVQPPFAIVPVPGSQATLGCWRAGPTFELADAVAREVCSGAVVSDVVRFGKPGAASRAGGPRDTRSIFERLRLVGNLAERRVILVDDVVVSGGHLRAVKAKLCQEGNARVLLAICAASVEVGLAADPLCIRHRWLSDYQPPRRTVNGQPRLVPTGAGAEELRP
jgi:predicted amidophosphoribosyltransferase